MTSLWRMRSILLAAGFTGAFAVRAVEIVRDGNPVAVIVLAQDASEQLRTAAGTLRDCLEEATGARLQITNTDPPAGGAAVYVGAGPRGAAFDVEQDGLDEDGFEILFPRPKAILIVGPTDWGTEFGVYEFLERYAGVRWLLPGPDGADIPKQATIDVPARAIRQEPAFVSRLFSGLRGGVQATWARRNRMHGRISFHHNLINLFPPETYTRSHPDFFPLRKDTGERFLPQTNATHRWQPCFSNPATVEEAVRNITDYFNRNPGTPSYSLGTNDSSGYCECAACLARIPGEKNFLGRQDYSDLYFSWANQVIEGVLQTHPDKRFGCLAYSEVAAPPKKVTVHERLVPYMTYDRMKWVDPEIRRLGEDLTRAWNRKSPVLGWYDYIYGTPYVLPRVWFHHMADYYRFGHANGVRALYAEAYPNWGEGPKLYVSLKLQWNPALNVDELLGDWFRRCVGPEAAPSLAAYYAHWEDFWTRRILDSKWFTLGGQYLNFSSPSYLDDISLDEIAESRRLLETTVAKAGTKRQRARAKLLLEAFEYYEATAYAYRAGAVPAGQAITSAKLALEVIDGAAAAMDYAVKRRRLALDTFPKHPVLVHPLPITRFGPMSGDSWSAGSLWRVYDWVLKTEGPVRGRIAELATSSPSEYVRGQAATMLRLATGELEPLTRNASFEEGKGARAVDWTWWVKWGVGGMRRSDDVAHTGRFSVLCEGMKRGGPVQQLDIAPGKYALICFVYVPAGQSPEGTTELSMTLRNAAGKNLPSASSKIVPVPGQWTAMAVAAEVPNKIGSDEVKKVLPILIVDGFEPGEKVYFDDLVLCRMEE